ncbi:MAG TPA: FMN-binding protein [Spirochaetota bacterium]|nr:FMN-binding protein [Spirochaetota bacterium]HPQ54584.1 FMN-binding protein [Spirochaetota bacterium]
MNKSSPGYILAFIIALSVVFGFGISFVNYATVDLLKKNEALHRNRVISSAFMLSVSGNNAADYEGAVKKEIRPFSLTARGKTIQGYRHTATGNLGFVFSGTGFWDKITGIIVLSPDLSTVKNIHFLDQKETPGLGARIEEPQFTAQFRGIQPAWDRPETERIIIGASPDPGAKNRVDAITGATQTSIALMQALNRELAAFKKAYSQRESNTP